MTDRYTASLTQDVNTSMLTAAVALVGIGSVIGLAGFGLGAVALIGAIRHWYERKDLTPAQHAKLTWDQARAATSAGAQAWKGIDKSHYTQTPAP